MVSKQVGDGGEDPRGLEEEKKHEGGEEKKHEGGEEKKHDGGEEKKHDGGEEKKHDGSPAKPDSNGTESPIPAEEELVGTGLTEEEQVDPAIREQQAFIESHKPRTELEVALFAQRERQMQHIERLTAEVRKLNNFISKRKQTYKRKRKESGAPTRALSAYNIFVQERFKKLSRENEVALKSADTDAQLKRVPPASLVASTGNQWKELSAEEKAHYEEKAKTDRKRYEEEMASYQAPEKPGSRKRNKTGYNMFFSQHVLRLKQTEGGVPSERGSVARLVGEAWKQLSPEEKHYYEQEADINNQEHPVDPKAENGGGDDEDGGGGGRRGRMPKAPKSQYQPPPPPPQAGGVRDPREAPPPGGAPPPPPGYSDYGQQGQGGSATDHYAQSMQAAAYGQYPVYGQGHPPPSYGGYPPQHGGADAYGYGPPPPHYGYPQHGYGHYPQDGSSQGA